MSLPHVILGFLNHAPSSGYDLKKTFDATVQHFWPADQSQIYRTLSGLVNQGLVQMEEVIQSGKPNKKVYTITSEGTEELLSWLRSAKGVAVVRNVSLVRMFFSGNLPDEELIRMCDAVEEGLRSNLERYSMVPELIADEAVLQVSARDRFFWLLTLEYGLAVSKAELDWIISIKERLKEKSYINEFNTI
jgi:DNA-binding PadR family transcriptional regulator